MRAEFDPVQATRQERLDLCDYLDTLTPVEWTVPSLCPGWTVKDVVAHVTTSTRTGMKEFAIEMIRAGGDFDRMELRRALTIAEQSRPCELIGLIRQTAGSRTRAPFSSPLDPLVDILVHFQDIARPLGHDRPMETERATAALEHVATSRWYGARARLEGLDVAATDSAWSSSRGDPLPDNLSVAGTTADLLLAATGRVVGLSSLVGPGVPRLTEHLS